MSRPGDGAKADGGDASRSSAQLLAYLRGHGGAVGPALDLRLTTPMTLPIARMPSPAAPVCATAAATMAAISSPDSGAGR